MKEEKRLHLLKPNVQQVFVGTRGLEEARYIQLEESVDLTALKKDVQAGAVQFQGCIDQLKKTSSNVILVEADTKEEGLMAVSYLANVFYQSEKKMLPERTYEDYEEDGWDYDEFDEEDWEATPDGANRMMEWIEMPNRIPIVSITEVRRYCSNNNYEMSFGPMMVSGMQANARQVPYWTDCTRDSICIMSDANIYDCFKSSDSELFKRFASNRHVFVLQIKGNSFVSRSLTSEESQFDDLVPNADTLDDFSCRMLLDYTADQVVVTMTKEERTAYMELLFENWIEAFDMKIAKDFPISFVVGQIVSLNMPDKSELMEKTIRYVLKDGHESDELTQKDFEKLAIFRTLKKADEDSALTKMDKFLVGMEAVKQHVKNIIEVMEFQRKRQNFGLSSCAYHNTHLLIGAPGTAKTTIAKMMADAMFEKGLLPGNRFVSVNGSELKGKYVGHTAPKVKALFDEHDAIFIDEAYSIASASHGSMDAYGQEAISQLIIEMEEHATDKLILFAGYGGTTVRESDNKMKEFIDANPGIKSRINSTIFFDSYTPEDMVKIVQLHAKTMDFTITKKANELIRSYFAERCVDRSFGNGREARSFVETCMMFVAHRAMSLAAEDMTKKAFQEIRLEDVKLAIEKLQAGSKQQKGRKNNCGFLG